MRTPPRPRAPAPRDYVAQPGAIAQHGIGLIGIETIVVEIAGAIGGEPVDPAGTGAERGQGIA